MEIKSYRARSVQEALALVRADLGPDAAVLHTREVTAGGKWFGGDRQIEVIATPEAEQVPSRLPEVASAPPAQPARKAPFRAQLASVAAGGLDLAQAEAAAVDEVAHAVDAGAWPREVATHFLEMLRALPPEERRRVVSAIADVARGAGTP